MAVVALVVDDNQLNLEILSALLRKEGAEAITLLNPNDILSTLERVEKIDIVFLDLEFPNHDGLVIIGELKKDSRLQGVPIVAYSGHISELQEAHDAGFHSFLGKPLEVSAFPNLLQRILKGEQVWSVGQ